MADYTCTSVGCYDYQSPQMHANIAALQAAINRFSQDPDYGFAPIPIDYIVGTTTTTALWVVLTNLMNMNTSGSQTGGLIASQAQGFYGQINTPQDVMISMGDLVSFLQGAADSLGAPNVPTPSTVSAPTRPVSTIGTKATIANVKTQFTKGSPLDAIMSMPPWVQILGGLALVGGGVMAYRKHKEKHG